MVDLDNDLHKKVKEFIEKKTHLEFVQIQQFVNVAVKEKLEELKKNN